jgi:hypothetical protein
MRLDNFGDSRRPRQGTRPGARARRAALPRSYRGDAYWLTRFTGGGVHEPSITATFGQ